MKQPSFKISFPNKSIFRIVINEENIHNAFLE